MSEYTLPAVHVSVNVLGQEPLVHQSKQPAVGTTELRTDWYISPALEQTHTSRQVVVDNLDTCSRCHETKPRSRFYLLKSGKPRSWCKVCEADYKRARQQTPDYKAWRRAYKHDHPKQWGYYWLMLGAPSAEEQEALAYL